MKTKKILQILIVTLVISIVFAGISYCTTGIVNGTAVRIRKSPSMDAEVLTNVYKKDEVKVLEKDGEWYKVTYENYEGYVHKSYIDVDDSQIPSASSDSKTDYIVTVDNTQNEEKTEPVSSASVSEIRVQDVCKLKSNAKLYILPLFSCPVLEEITSGSTVTVIQIANNWVYVQGENNVGWILKSTLEETSVTTNANENKNENENTSATKVGYVNVELANVREKASTSADAISTLKLDTEVTILGEENGWYKIQIGNTIGYISKKLVSDNKTSITTSRSIATSRSLQSSRTVAQENVVTATVGTAIEIVETKIEEQEAAKKEAELKAKQEEEAKQKAEAAKKAQATKKQTVAKDSAVEVSGSGATSSQIVSYAKQFVGYKYVSGGSSPSGFDCSGFTTYVFKHFGYSISRTASAQSKNGKAVSKSEMQPGDIIIFQNKEKTKIGHVGIYIGNNKFIHAENSKTGVVITSVDSGYYGPRFVCARRII